MTEQIKDSLRIEKNQGEIKIIFDKSISGKITLKDIGLTDEDLVFESGLIRLVLDLEQTKEQRKYFGVPTIEIAYHENMGETHWVCDFNRETILDKMDHQGHSTVMLLNRKRIQDLEHHHNNSFIIHAEFPEAVHLSAENSYIQLFN